jgi:hypothetical protein
MKIRPVGAELFHVDRRMDVHFDANSRFSQFAKAPKNSTFCPQSAFMSSVPIS